MRIEILVDNEEPQIFPLNKPRIVIGSHESCHITLNADGVSRKHLIIAVEDDNYYAIDQGSTNGSYINEMRLVPGRKVEFTSFFPLRLGDKVLVTLLSDEDASDLGFADLLPKEEATSSKIDTSGFSDSTRTISLKDLQSANTGKLQKNRHKTVAKRKLKTTTHVPPKEHDKSRMLFVKIFCIGLFGAAAYYNFYVLNSEVAPIPAPVSKIGELVAPAAELKPRFLVVNEIDFTAKERFDDISRGLACTNDLEKYLCDKFSTDSAGAIQSGTMVHLFLNGTDYIQKAKETIPAYKQIGDLPDPVRLKKHHDDVKFMAILLFLSEEVPKDLDYEMLKDVKLTFIIKFRKNGIPVVFVPESLSQFIKDFNPKDIELSKRHGADALKRFRDYFKTY